MEIPDLFLVLNIISHSFATLTREISCSTLEINLVFPHTHVLFSISFSRTLSSTFLFITSENEVKAIDLLTVDTTHVVRGLKYDDPMSISIDTAQKKIYFKNSTDIARSRLDGTDTKIILKKAEPYDMTIDWIRRRIFWTQWFPGKILVANLNGKEKRVLKVTKNYPEFIAVDPIVG